MGWAGKLCPLRVKRANTLVKIKNSVEQIKTGRCLGLKFHLGLLLVVELPLKPHGAL